MQKTSTCAGFLFVFFLAVFLTRLNMLEYRQQDTFFIPQINNARTKLQSNRQLDKLW